MRKKFNSDYEFARNEYEHSTLFFYNLLFRSEQDGDDGTKAAIRILDMIEITEKYALRLGPNSRNSSFHHSST